MIPRMDWGQVVANGGPPCFFVEGSQFCGRAERWQGHGNSAFHDYVSLERYIASSVPLCAIHQRSTAKTDATSAILSDERIAEIALFAESAEFHVLARAYINDLAASHRAQAALSAELRARVVELEARAVCDGCAQPFTSPSRYCFICYQTARESGVF